MSLTSLSPTITTLNRSILFSPLSSNGQEDTLSNYSLFKLMGQLTWSLLISMVTHSSLLPATTLEVPTTLTRLFINGMVPSSFFSNPFLPVEPLQGIHSRSAVIPTWAWPITTTAAWNITISQLCTRPLKHSSSSIKRFLDFPWSVWYDIIWVQRSHLSGSGKSVQWEVQHKQRFVQVGVEIGTKGKKRNDQES